MRKVNTVQWYHPAILKGVFWFSDCNWAAYWICVSIGKLTYLYNHTLYLSLIFLWVLIFFSHFLTPFFVAVALIVLHIYCFFALLLAPKGIDRPPVWLVKLLKLAASCLQHVSHYAGSTDIWAHSCCSAARSIHPQSTASLLCRFRKQIALV